MEGKYPHPKPDQKNANSSHGTGMDKTKGGSAGTMSNNGKGGAKSGGKSGC